MTRTKEDKIRDRIKARAKKIFTPKIPKGKAVPCPHCGAGMKPGNPIQVAGGTQGAIGFRCVRPIATDAYCPGNVILLSRGKFAALFPSLEDPPNGIEIDDRVEWAEKPDDRKRGTGKGAGVQPPAKPSRRGPQPEPVQDPE